jgi:hypothetical protein
MDLIKLSIGWYGLYSFDSGQGLLASTREHGKEPRSVCKWFST